jgi:hypothetical protein
MSDSMPARLAGTRWQRGHRHRWRQSRRSAYRLSCRCCQDEDGGSAGLDDRGSAAGDEPDAVGVGVGVGVGDGVGSVPVGADDGVGGT